MMAKFAFLPEAVLLFISPPLKPLTSKHPNQIYVNKRNSCTAEKLYIIFRSYWLLLLPITMEPFSFLFFRQLCLYIIDSLYFLYSIPDEFSLKVSNEKLRKYKYPTFCDLKYKSCWWYRILIQL